MAADRHTKSNGQGQGMNWCRPDLRISLYLRDGLACVYCASGIEDGTRLTLDHLVPHSLGGKNTPGNMVTCCHKCNSSRGNRDYKEFAEKVAGYLNHGITAQQIVDHIETTRQRPHDRKQAKEIISRRGSFSAALQSLR
jgi:hypothetical protein